MLVFGIIGWIASGVAFFIFLMAKSREDPDPDISLRYFTSGWQYLFVDPYGKRVIRSGYKTKRRAIKAASAHRAQVGRQLELSLRLDEVGVEP